LTPAPDLLQPVGPQSKPFYQADYFAVISSQISKNESPSGWSRSGCCWASSHIHNTHTFSYSRSLWYRLESSDTNSFM